MPIDVTFDVSHEAVNPYDPETADIVGEIIAPDGTRTEHPAFWLEPYDLVLVDGEEVARRAGPGHWQWRFTPPTPGEWRWRLVGRIRFHGEWLEATTDWQTTRVAAPTTHDHAFIRRSADPRFWETSTGAFFYPIGMNVRSPSDTRQNRLLINAGAEERSEDFEALGTRAYELWFADMGANDLNYARVWMCPWWCGLEWTPQWDEYGGLLFYNQAAAARLDRVVELARNHNIYLQLEIQNHGMTSPHVDSQWDLSPYNWTNGGPCRHPAEFFTSEEAWRYHQARLRYTVARWGQHSHVMAWVLSSELEFTGAWWGINGRGAYRSSNGHDPTTQAWIERNLAWFRQHDLSQRPVSIHFSHPWRGARLWRETEGLGFSNSNVYTGFQRMMGQLGGARAGLASAMGIYLEEHFPPWELDRPTMIGEWGGHWEETDPERLAAELRTGTWLQAVLPYGGNVGFWWWLWVDAADEWDRYAAVATFMSDIDRRGQNERPYRPTVNGGDVRAYCYGSRGDTQHLYYVWLAGLDRSLERFDASHYERDAGTVAIETERPNSRWRVERFSGDSGEVVDVTSLNANNRGVVQLRLGQLRPDAVFRLVMVGGDDHEPSSGPSREPSQSGP